MNIKQYSFLLLTLFCQVLWCLGLIYASLNTIQSQAYVFNNIHGLFLVLIGALAGARPSKSEMIGVLIALAGCVCMIIDPKALRNGNQQASVLPAVLDAGSAVFGALYFIMSARNVKKIPICLLVSLMSFHTFLINSVIAKIENP
jgi:drug/metabolite transporter (DMT)-like permease